MSDFLQLPMCMPPCAHDVALGREALPNHLLAALPNHSLAATTVWQIS